MSRILPAAALLIFASCDRPLDTPAGLGPALAVNAADASCTLPLRHFAPHRRRLTGSFLDYPTNLVSIDRAGRLRWNSVPVEPRRLRDYIAHQARIEPPPVLVIQPERDAPCAVVRETIAAALREGRCTPQRCAFEWPGDMAPPPSEPPPLPDRALLLGNWVLVSIDGAPPPPLADPVEIVFTDGAVGARSQCVHWSWLTAVEARRLRLRTPPGPVAMCARATSPWEDRFAAAMAAAERIDSDGKAMTVTGPKGILELARPN